MNKLKDVFRVGSVVCGYTFWGEKKEYIPSSLTLTGYLTKKFLFIIMVTYLIFYNISYQTMCIRINEIKN